MVEFIVVLKRGSSVVLDVGDSLYEVVALNVELSISEYGTDWVPSVDDQNVENVVE